MSKIQPGLPKGMRDFLPEQMLKRQFVMNTIRGIFEKYGYEPLETPSIEKLKILSGKYGDEGEQLMFKVLRRGTGLEELRRGQKEFVVTDYGQVVEESLRYDLTVPLSRVIAMHQDKLLFPFKRYQIQPVWRADRPQRGRFREFYQCDIDAVGVASLLADAEAICILNEVLTTLGFNNFQIRINNRKLLNGIIESVGLVPSENAGILVAIDKLDKIGFAGVEKALSALEVTADKISAILDILAIAGNAPEMLDRLLSRAGDTESLRAGAEELTELFEFLYQFQVDKSNWKLDLFLVRGLGYYTGPVFESVVEKPAIGSIAGGGRYDGLIGMFLGRNIPATGVSFGIERIIEVMAELELLPDLQTKTHVYVTVFDLSTQANAIAFAQKLRVAGICAELCLDSSKFKKQMNFANRKNIPFVAVIGPDEIAQGKVNLKNMRSGAQELLSEEEAISKLKK